MGIDNAQLTPINTPLVGFSGEVVEALGEITLPVSLGSYPMRVTKMVKFLRVNASSAYNVILGRPSLNMFQVVGSTYHMKLKFPTSEGVGKAVGDSRLARECHVNILRDSAKCKRKTTMDEISLKKKKQLSAVGSTHDEVHTIEEEIEINKNFEATEALKRIEITPGNSEKTLKIGTEMTPELEEKLTVFLRKYADVFAWQGEFLPGIPSEYALHHLNVDPRMKPVKQKKRSFGAEKNKHILAEVEKLVKNNYIRPILYPEWLENVVLVPKQGGKWRLCIEFTDLNKACPKDLFPLPRIDLLVDSTAGCELLSFLDAYQGYNQIALAPKDQEKASFITDQGIYCYEVMPFGLKNAGATYQRLVNKMFEKLIGRSMEVYIDDMLVKSVLAVKHIDDLGESFEILRKYRMRLNPKKCAFGVRGGKFLGYMVSQREIEANPEKIKAVLSMTPPKSIKGLQELAGRIVALNRFISRSADKGLSFFKVLRQGKGFRWTEECQHAFNDLKKYLMASPLLVKPDERDTLLLYLAVSSEAVSAVLTVEREQEHKHVYYVSKVLQGAELCHTNIEKLALAIIVACRKLRPYFLSHQITALTNHPLKKILSSPEASGSGAGVLVQNPQGDKFQYAIRFRFSSSNNEVEYEALIIVIKLALAAGARKLVAYSDSQLVVNQVQGTYEAKENNMKKYLSRVRDLLMRLENFEMKQIPRAENEVADQLAKLGSSSIGIDSRKITLITCDKEEVEAESLDVLCANHDEPSWNDEIIKYFLDGELPPQQDQARKLMVRAARFTLIDGELYKRGYSQPYLKCLAPAQANYVLREIHEGICGNHLGEKALAGKSRLLLAYHE
ncbi:uncharacterized protein [Henckelia pumila]|uniref:uncharacterized protein n=1 Tax=Henckelia pumila TaxID=405737 RepID=UPI003C6E7DBF